MALPRPTMKSQRNGYFLISTFSSILSDSALSWLACVNFTSFLFCYPRICILKIAIDECLQKSLICFYLNSQIPPLCKLIIRLKDWEIIIKPSHDFNFRCPNTLRNNLSFIWKSSPAFLRCTFKHNMVFSLQCD